MKRAPENSEFDDGLQDRKRSRAALFFPLQPLSSYKTAQPPQFQQPKELSHYSLDENRTYKPDASELRQYAPMDTSIPLTDGYERYKARDSSVPEHLDTLLRTVKNEGLLEHLRTKPGVSLVTWRGIMTKILTAPYDNREHWILRVTRHKGIFYIEEQLTSAKIEREQNMSRQELLQSYMGYRFESLSTVPLLRPSPCISHKDLYPTPEVLAARRDDSVNNNVQFCTVLRTGISSGRTDSSIGINLILGAEVDCQTSGLRPNSPPPTNPPPPLSTYIELKTHRLILNPSHRASFERHKLLKIWAQSFLAGVPRVIIGFRDDQGYVRAIEEFKTLEIPRIVRRPDAQGGAVWDPNVMLTWCYGFLRWLTSEVALKDDWRTVYRVSFRGNGVEVEEEIAECGDKSKAPTEGKSEGVLNSFLPICLLLPKFETMSVSNVQVEAPKVKITTQDPRLMNRPAPPQMDAAAAKANGPSRHADAGIGDRSTQYNIWYNRWLGDLDRKKGGLTLHSSAPVQLNEHLRGVIHFKIQDTRVVHANDRIVAFSASILRMDVAAKVPNANIFTVSLALKTKSDGRGRRTALGEQNTSAENRDDMGGTGSFLKDSRTLYMNRIAPYKDIKAVVIKHYSEFGEIEHVNVLPSKNVAFVRFRHRLQAEFAKEAMFGQSLDSNEILNVRWATADPHMDRRLKGMMDEVEHGLYAVDEDQKTDDAEGGRETKRRRVEYRAEGKYGTGTVVGVMDIGEHEDEGEESRLDTRKLLERGSTAPAGVSEPSVFLQPLGSSSDTAHEIAQPVPSDNSNGIPSSIVSSSALAYLRQMTEKMKTAGVRVEVKSSATPKGSGAEDGMGGLGMLAGYDSDEEED
ncbi:Dom-3 Z [Gonapodya sp. JEL0774]|nr:Dom-3 Z [Gonapodya sp. JEL0774]